MSKKKPTLKFFSNEEICSLSPLNIAKIKNSGIFMIYLMYSTIVKSLTESDKNLNFLFKLFDTAVTLK